MRADDLQLNELVSFNEGQFSLHGRRLVLHDLHAFAQFRKDLISMVGLDDARRALIRFGYFWGEADAAAMKRIFQWESVGEWLRAGPRLHSLQGVARATINTLEFDEAGPRFLLDVNWANSGEAEEHIAEFGQTDHAVCWMLVGYASGYASFCLGRKVYFIEQCCRAKGDAVCTAIGKDVASWGETLTKYLPYFEGDDIQSRIPVWVRDGWGEKESTVVNDARAAGSDSPIIYVYVPKASADDLQKAIVEYEAAKSTLEFKGTPTTPEGREARDAMATRMATAEASRNQIVNDVIDRAKVFQGGGSERYELNLVAKVESAAQASLDRLFPNFKSADDNRWANVINRAKNGDEAALSAVDWTDAPEKHPVCAAGSGRLAIGHLAGECAYEHWHRMLFARFLAENGLLIEPQECMAISLAEAEELAKEEGVDVWVFASRCAQRMLPQIFRPDDRHRSASELAIPENVSSVASTHLAVPHMAHAG